MTVSKHPVGLANVEMRAFSTGFRAVAICCGLLSALCITALTTTSCAQGPEPMYEGPAGRGNFVYDPRVGITRSDAAVNQTEQSLYDSAAQAYSQRQWDECIALTRSITETYPEGARAVDALILRIRANFEAGREGTDGRFSKTIPLYQWMFIYMAPEHDDRLRQLRAVDEATRSQMAEIRALRVQDFIDWIEPDALALYRSGRLESAQRDVDTLVNYYMPAMQLTEYRRQVTELGRDVCWLMYAAQDFNRTITLADDLVSVNPPPSVKGDTLFIMGQAQRRNGAAVIAANTFGTLYRGAGLGDTDTRWRPYALMWQIDQTMAASKGYNYDVSYYERALELLGEYELYRYENPNIPAPLHAEFIALFETVYEVFAAREREAADTYARIGERRAAQHHMQRAVDYEAQLEKRIAALASR